MQTILTVLQLFLSLGLIGLVLIQHGKGADAGAAFGSGASATVFGARGSGNFLSRTTAILAALFFMTSIALGYYAAQAGKQAGIMDGVDALQIDEPLPSEVPLAPPTGSGAGGVPVMPGSAVPAPPLSTGSRSDAASQAAGSSAVPAFGVPETESAPPKSE